MILNTVTWGSGGGEDILSDLTTQWWSTKNATVLSSNMRPLTFANLTTSSTASPWGDVVTQMRNISIAFPNMSSIPDGFFFNSIQPMGLPMSEAFPNVTTIGAYAFCTNGVTGIYTSEYALLLSSVQAFYSDILTNFSKVTVIKNYAFARWFGVSLNGTSASFNISFPEALTIGSYAFAELSSPIYYPSYSYLPVYADNTTNKGYRLIRRGSISLPKAVTIGNGAFVGATGYSILSLPQCTTIGAGAFGTNIHLQTVDIPKCVSIDSQAFAHCNSLTAISAPLLESIGNSAFYSCSLLTSISFPKCTYIGTSAFGVCSALTNVSLPLLVSVLENTFLGCTALVTISLPAVTLIGSSAFLRCSYLDAAYFYWTGTNRSVCSSAFYSCYRLKSLYLLGSNVKPLQNKNAFTSTPISTYTTVLGTNGSIFVPQSLLANYKAAANWVTYSARFVGLTDAEVSAILLQMGVT